MLSTPGCDDGGKVVDCNLLSMAFKVCRGWRAVIPAEAGTHVIDLGMR